MVVHVGQAVAAGEAASNVAEALTEDHEAEGDPDLELPDGERPDMDDIFRYESWFSKNEMRVEVAQQLFRTVMGDESVEVGDYYFRTRGNINVSRGERERSAGSYYRSVDNDDVLLVGNKLTERVEGVAHVQATLSAEAIVGGAYVNTITGAYLRLAGWVDFLAWGGWAEVDAARAELAATMIRSHMSYAHAAGCRLTMASRLVDDFQYREENFATWTVTGNTYTYAGAPGSGVTSEA